MRVLLPLALCAGLACPVGASAKLLPSVSSDLLGRLRTTKVLRSAFARQEQFIKVGAGRCIRTAGGALFRLQTSEDEPEPKGIWRNLALRVRAAAQENALPDAADHRDDMPPIRSQGARSTCVVHASLAALEAFPEVPDDLSEQDAYWVCQDAIRHDWPLGRWVEKPGNHVRDDKGIKTTDAAKFLKKKHICEERYSKYIDDREDLTEADEQRSDQAKDHAFYGIAEAEVLGRDDIRNGTLVARLLSEGHNLVAGFGVAWDEHDVRKQGGVMDVVLDEDGDPVPAEGGHAMLIVGYDLAKKQFIVRNSWGTDWGDAGYCYMTADYLKTYAKYGFFVKRAAVDDGGAAARLVASAAASTGGAATERLSLLGR